jgi:hypothetical protein
LAEIFHTFCTFDVCQTGKAAAPASPTPRTTHKLARRQRVQHRLASICNVVLSRDAVDPAIYGVAMLLKGHMSPQWALLQKETGGCDSLLLAAPITPTSPLPCLAALPCPACYSPGLARQLASHSAAASDSTAPVMPSARTARLASRSPPAAGSLMLRHRRPPPSPARSTRQQQRQAAWRQPLSPHYPSMQTTWPSTLHRPAWACAAWRTPESGHQMAVASAKPTWWEIRYIAAQLTTETETKPLLHRRPVHIRKLYQAST